MFWFFLQLAAIACQIILIFLLIFGCKDKTVEAKTADGKKSWLRYDTKKMVRYLVLLLILFCAAGLFEDLSNGDAGFWSLLAKPLIELPIFYLGLAIWVISVRRKQRRELDEEEERKREEWLVLRDQRIAEMKQAAEQEKAQTEAEDSEPAAADKE